MAYHEMLTESWKQKIVRYAHSRGESRLPLRTRLSSPKIALGQQFYLRKNMSRSLDWLKQIQGEIHYNELLENHTSIRVGGPADVFILPQGIEDLKTIFKNKGDSSLFFLGEGTNLLVRDKGIRGIVVCLKEAFKSIDNPVFSKTPEGGETAVIKAQAGVKTSYLAKMAARYSLTGLEGLVGVPGSLGGALVMNAGAEGVEIGPVVRSVTRLTEDGELQTLQRDELEFHYRKTVFPPGGGIIVEAELELEKGDPAEILSALDRNLAKRARTQPLNLPNSGSVFKNPPGHKAAELIQSAGLKGTSMGGASVSLKHSNFIVNNGAADAEDVLGLIEHVQQVVKEKTGIELEQEIIVVGE